MSDRFYIGQRVKATDKMDFHMENPCYGTVIKEDNGSVLVDWDKENAGMHTGGLSISQSKRKNPEQGSCFYVSDDEIAPLNDMEKIVDALGVYVGQRFNVYDTCDDIMENSPFMFDGEDFVDRDDDVLSPDEYEALVTGRIEPLADSAMKPEKETKDPNKRKAREEA